MTAPAAVVRLSPRERQAVAVAAQGATIPEGAREMGVAPKTYESFLLTARRKFGARNRTHLVFLAYSSGAMKRPR